MAQGGLELGRRIAPPRFLAFIALVAIGGPIGISMLGWREGPMVAFDVAALVFLLLCLPMLRFEADQMRDAAKRNDANRIALLAITGIVMLAVLVAVAAELTQKGSPKPPVVALIVGTLTLAWFFSNTIYTLHYAHLFYTSGKDEDKGDCGGLDFPKTDEPDYWDFVYFAFCLGMTFQTSDVEMTDGRMRRTATAHCLAAFVFNLGVLAFTINVLGGG